MDAWGAQLGCACYRCEDALIGIPLAAASAFCIVLIFEARAGRVEFEALGFRFRGGAGPAVIWVFAFLAIVGAIRLLW
jgi:hypothetical protein